MSNDPFAKYVVDSHAIEESLDPFAKYVVNDNMGVEPKAEVHSRGLGASALRQVGRLGRAAVTGITGIADIPNLAAMGLHAAGLKETPTFYDPLAGRVQQSIDSLTGGSLKPENKTEEYVDMISEGIAPMALTGGTSLTGSAARGLSKTGAKLPTRIAQATLASPEPTAANLAQSVGSSAALKAYIDEGGDPGLLGPLLASMAGGVGARGAMSAAKNIAKSPYGALAETVGRVTGFSPEKYAKNKDLGLPSSLATASNKGFPTSIELIASKNPSSMDTLREFHQNREAAIAHNLGVRFPEELEATIKNIPIELAKKGAKGYHKRASDIYENRMEKFRPRELEAIANKETVDVTPMVKKLENERGKFATEESAKSLFDTSPEGELLENLKLSDPKIKARNAYETLKKQGLSDESINYILKKEFGDIDLSKNEIGYYDLDELRKKALKEYEKASAPIGGGTTETREAAIRHEMLAGRRHQFAEEVGTPEQIKSTKQARKFWSSYKDTKKDNEKGMAEYVSKITGADNDTKAFQKLISDNPKYIRIARNGLNNNDRPKLASSIIEHIGDRQGRFNINAAHTRFQKMPHASQEEFLKTLPNKAAQDNFKGTMNLIGENKRQMEWLANTSNTAHTNEAMKLIEKYGSAAASALSLVAGYATGSFTPLVLMAIQYAGFKHGAKIWTDQRFLRRVNETILASNKKGKANKLDMLLKTIEQAGAHTKHMDNSYAKGGAVKIANTRDARNALKRAARKGGAGIDVTPFAAVPLPPAPAAILPPPFVPIPLVARPKILRDHTNTPEFHEGVSKKHISNYDDPRLPTGHFQRNNQVREQYEDSIYRARQRAREVESRDNVGGFMLPDSSGYKMRPEDLGARVPGTPIAPVPGQHNFRTTAQWKHGTLYQDNPGLAQSGTAYRSSFNPKERLNPYPIGNGVFLTTMVDQEHEDQSRASKFAPAHPLYRPLPTVPRNPNGIVTGYRNNPGSMVPVESTPIAGKRAINHFDNMKNPGQKVFKYNPATSTGTAVFSDGEEEEFGIGPGRQWTTLDKRLPGSAGPNIWNP